MSFAVSLAFHLRVFAFLFYVHFIVFLFGCVCLNCVIGVYIFYFSIFIPPLKWPNQKIANILQQKKSVHSFNNACLVIESIYSMYHKKALYIYIVYTLFKNCVNNCYVKHHSYIVMIYACIRYIPFIS